MRRLWTDERINFEGEWYRTENATIYDRPDEPVPIYVAASGPLAAKLAGRVGDGFIMTSGKARELYEELGAAMEEGARDAGRDPAAIVRMMEVKVSYDHDLEYAKEACEYWAPLALTPEQKRTSRTRSSSNGSPTRTRDRAAALHRHERPGGVSRRGSATTSRSASTIWSSTRRGTTSSASSSSSAADVVPLLRG